MASDGIWAFSEGVCRTR